MIEEPIHISDESYEKAVLQSALPVVVDFWAPWCGPCKMVAPLLDQAAKKYAGKIVVAKVNVDDDSDTAGSLGIQSIPTLIFYKNGEIVNRHSGSLPAAQLDNMIQDLID